jgi:hypothetical protein
MATLSKSFLGIRLNSREHEQKFYFLVDFDQIQTAYTQLHFFCDIYKNKIKMLGK